MMKRILILALALGMAAAVRAEDPLPAAFPASRYQKMSAHSPFSPPTPVAAAPAPAPTGPTISWTDKYAVTSLMQSGGKYIATLLDRDSGDRIIVTSDKASEGTNMVVSSVQWSDKVEQTRVTIRRGAELGQVAFDSNGGSGGGNPPPPMPQPQNTVPRPNIPGAPIFHPPPGISGTNPNLRAPANVIRRPPIGAMPARAVPPRITPPRLPPGRVPPKDDDDDDDDN